MNQYPGYGQPQQPQPPYQQWGGWSSQPPVAPPQPQWNMPGNAVPPGNGNQPFRPQPPHRRKRLSKAWVGTALVAAVCVGIGSWSYRVNATESHAGEQAGSHSDGSNTNEAIGPTASSVPSAAPSTGSCEPYDVSVYGVDPNAMADQDTGGGYQLITVVASKPTSHTGVLTAWQFTDGCWSPAQLPGGAGQPLKAQLGKNGVVDYDDRRQGSSTTPAGTFTLGEVIYANPGQQNPNDSYEFHTFECGDYWDQQPGSPTYGTFQHVDCDQPSPAYAASSEKLWQVGQAYDHFINIEMPESPQHASGIFLHHNSKSGSTAGCVALADGTLEDVLSWLNPDEDPHMRIQVAQE